MRRRFETLLIVIGVTALGYAAWGTLEASLYQAYENRELDAILASAPASATNGVPLTPPPVAGTSRSVPPGSVLGRIEIPRLKVSAIVRAGSDARTLQLAVGHIPGTALPGLPGNVGLAGHRDTFFRQLQHIAPDDEIRLVTPDGRYTYQVERTDIVQPSDVWVLDDTAPLATLTLVTCYPFAYLGSAPERFVVRAVMAPAAAGMARR